MLQLEMAFSGYTLFIGMHKKSTQKMPFEVAFMIKYVFLSGLRLQVINRHRHDIEMFARASKPFRALFL